jgi:hypothetical protein
MPSESQKRANKRYRDKNYERVKSINRKSNAKQYLQMDTAKKSLTLSYHREQYQKTRNYRAVDNMAVSFKNLFG